MAMVLLLAVALIFVIRAAPFEVLGDIRPGTVTLSAVLMIGSMQIIFLLLATETWRRVVRVLTGANVGLVSSYMQLAAVAVGKYVPGKVWGFLARTGEMNRKNVPVHMAVMSSVVEQMLLLAGALVVAVGAAMVAIPQLSGPVLIVGIAGLAGIVFASMKIPTIANWLLRKKMPNALPVRIDGYHPIGILRFVFAYAVIWLFSGAIFSTIYFSLFDVAVTAERVAALVLGNTLGIALGFFAFFVPGGIGVREAVATIVLAPFVPVREALLAAVAYRAWMVLIDGLNGVVLLVREARRNNTLPAAVEGQND